MKGKVKLVRTWCYRCGKKRVDEPPKGEPAFCKPCRKELLERDAQNATKGLFS